MTRALRYMTGAVFALALLECAHQTDWASRIEWEELSFDRLPGKSDYPGAGAVVLLDDGKMEIYGSPPIVISYFEKHRIIKVLDKSGLRHANVALSYTGKSEIDFIQA